MDLLRQALQSHRFAITLNDSNIDILFNTANVLSDLADRIVHSKEEAIPLLQEAVKLIRRCLERQVQEYDALQAALLAANSCDAPPNAAPTRNTSSSASSGEEYATVEEAVTEQSILDSGFLLAHVLADLLEIYPAERVEAIRMDVEAAVGLFSSGALEPYLNKLDKTAPEPGAPPPSSRQTHKPHANPSLPTETPSLSLSLSLSAAPPKPSHPQPSDHAEALAEGALAAARLFAAVSEVEYRRGERSAASWYATVLTKFAATDASVDANAHGALIDALSSIARALDPANGNDAEVARAGEGELSYLAGAPAVAGTDDDDAATNIPAPAALDAVTDAWTPAQIHADALGRAYHVLASTLAGGDVEADKAPQLYIALGDVHWRLRGAIMTATSIDVAGAVAQARRAERCWAEAARKARAVGVAGAEEQVEAEDKAKISAMLRREAVVGGEAREGVLLVVDEMREDGLLHDVLAREVLKMVGAA